VDLLTLVSMPRNMAQQFAHADALSCPALITYSTLTLPTLYESLGRLGYTRRRRAPRGRAPTNQTCVYFSGDWTVIRRSHGDAEIACAANVIFRSSRLPLLPIRLVN